MWHGLAKLRLQTETTVRHLEIMTRVLGQALRVFRDVTCSQFATEEFDREVKARSRKNAQQGKPGHPEATREPKGFNMSTPKMHALGHYAFFIRWFGSTDSYSTQIVSELA